DKPAESAAPAEAEAAAAPPVAAPAENEQAQRAAPTARPAPRIAPAVAHTAAEHRIPLERVQQMEGSGRGGRVTKKDLLACVEQGEAAAAAAPAAEPELMPWEQPGSGDLFKPTDDLYRPAVKEASPEASTPAQAPADHVHAPPPAPGKPGEVVPLSKMRRRIAEHMVESKLKIAPHVTTVFEADMSAVARHRAANKDEFARR